MRLVTLTIPRVEPRASLPRNAAPSPLLPVLHRVQDRVRYTQGVVVGHIPGRCIPPIPTREAYIPGYTPTIPTREAYIPGYTQGVPPRVYHRVYMSHLGIPQGVYVPPGYTSGCAGLTGTSQGVQV